MRQERSIDMCYREGNAKRTHWESSITTKTRKEGQRSININIEVHCISFNMRSNKQQRQEKKIGIDTFHRQCVGK